MVISLLCHRKKTLFGWLRLLCEFLYLFVNFIQLRSCKSTEIWTLRSSAWYLTACLFRCRMKSSGESLLLLNDFFRLTERPLHSCYRRDKYECSYKVIAFA